MLTAGTHIGPYQIIAQLGAGGMGEVYLAEDTKLDRRVAIKFLPVEQTSDEQARKRLIREARAAAKLDHPNICAIHEVGEEGGRSFIVMQYVEGETLAMLIERQPLEVREAVDVAVQMADALAEAHSRGIIHRDIKPQNVMITARGQVKVLDFGLAKLVQQPQDHGERGRNAKPSNGPRVNNRHRAIYVAGANSRRSPGRSQRHIQLRQRPV